MLGGTVVELQLLRAGRKLPLSEAFHNALDKALEVIDRYEVKHEAAMRTLIAAVNHDMRVAGNAFASFKHSAYLTEVIAMLGEAGHIGLTQKSEREHLQTKVAAQDELERGTLINKILNNKSTYPILRYGQTRAQSGDHLQKESSERLREIYAEVTRVRNLKNETREQQRERLKAAAVEAGHVVQPKRDSLDGVTGGSSEWSRGEAAKQQSGFGNELFTNPRTGTIYTRSEALALAKSPTGRDLFRKLMQSNLTLLNEVVSGKHGE